MPELTQAERADLVRKLQAIQHWASTELDYVRSGAPQHTSEADRAFYADYVNTVRQAI